MNETIRYTITARPPDNTIMVQTEGSVKYDDISTDEHRVATAVLLDGLRDIVLVGMGL